MIHTYNEFLTELDRCGMLLLWSKSEYLSLSQMTPDENWHTGSELDPWLWRTRLALQRDGAYAHLFRGQGMLISKSFYPVVYAAFHTDMEYEYDSGRITQAAMRMWELFEEQDTWSRPKLRRAMMREAPEKPTFEAALLTLEANMQITISGSVQPTSFTGSPVGWQAMDYARADVWLKDFLPEELPSREEARQLLLERIHCNCPAISASGFKKVFGTI